MKLRICSCKKMHLNVSSVKTKHIFIRTSRHGNVFPITGPLTAGFPSSRASDVALSSILRCKQPVEFVVDLNVITSMRCYCIVVQASLYQIVLSQGARGSY